ncbi:DUF6134 family protein [Nisaea denitrificans]|uniref:DUF6134 family protein n=1 Tax=Nisaea denitrificans TaxID=390877 RepID=UPI00048AEB0A|nr:DUF6134 family protein [Nisaea denitrificans]
MKCSLFRYFRVFALLLLVTPVAFAFSSPLWANAPSGWAQDGLIKFQVFRNDSPLGVVMLRFNVNNDVYTVDTQTLFDYRIGPFSLYYYALRARDEWSGPLLLSARGMVNDDGEIFRVDGEAEPEGFRFSGGEGEHLAPLGTSVPSTYWNTALTRASELIDLQYGRLRKITMTKTGPETILSKGERIEAERYQMRGELDLDIWYDKRGEWAKMSFTVDDSNFEYVRIVPRAGDETRFLELESVKDIGSEEIRNVLRELE